MTRCVPMGAVVGLCGRASLCQLTCTHGREWGIALLDRDLVVPTAYLFALVRSSGTNSAAAKPHRPSRKELCRCKAGASVVAPQISATFLFGCAEFLWCRKSQNKLWTHISIK